MQKPCNIGPKWLNLWQLGEPHQLAECVKELRRCMWLLTTFTEEQVLLKDPPSPWFMITPSWGPAVAEEEAPESRKGKGQQAPESPYTWGSFPTPTLLGCSKCTHHCPCDNYLYSHYPQQVDWHTKYFYTTSVNTSRQSCGAKANMHPPGFM